MNYLANANRFGFGLIGVAVSSTLAFVVLGLISLVMTGAMFRPGEIMISVIVLSMVYVPYLLFVLGISALTHFASGKSSAQLW